MSLSNDVLDEQYLKLDLKFLNNVPKSPTKMPKINADRRIGIWQVCEFVCSCRLLQIINI